MNIQISPNDLLDYGQEFYYNEKLVTLIPVSDTGFKYSLDPRDAHNYFGVAWKSAHNPYMVWKAYQRVSDITNITISQVPQQTSELNVNSCTIYVRSKRRNSDVY